MQKNYDEGLAAKGHPDAICLDRVERVTDGLDVLLVRITRDEDKLAVLDEVGSTARPL